MSKYEDLCKELEKVRDEFAAYEKESFAFIEKFVGEYKEFLKIPEDCFEIVPTHEKIDKGVKYRLAGVMHFDEEGFWRFGMRLTLPKLRMLMRFKLTKNRDTSFSLQVDGVEEHFTVRADVAQDFVNVYETLQKKMIGLFSWRSMPALSNQPGPLKTIGFRP